MPNFQWRYYLAATVNGSVRPNLNLDLDLNLNGMRSDTVVLQPFDDDGHPLPTAAPPYGGCGVPGYAMQSTAKARRNQSGRSHAPYHRSQKSVHSPVSKQSIREVVLCAVALHNIFSGGICQGGR
jgi:hypothetical protein